MSYGLEIHNTEGSILLNEQEKQYVYYGKTVDGVGNIPSGNKISFTNNSGYATRATQVYSYQEYPAGVETVYYFVPITSIPSTDNYGVELYDSNGNMFWHSGRPPLILWSYGTVFSKVAIIPTIRSFILNIYGNEFGGGTDKLYVSYAIGGNVKALVSVSDSQSLNFDEWINPYKNTPLIDAAFYDNYPSL